MRGDAQNAKARAAELQIAPRVRVLAARMRDTIHLNNEADAGSKEINDEEIAFGAALRRA